MDYGVYCIVVVVLHAVVTCCCGHVLYVVLLVVVVHLELLLRLVMQRWARKTTVRSKSSFRGA